MFQYALETLPLQPALLFVLLQRRAKQITTDCNLGFADYFTGQGNHRSLKAGIRANVSVVT
jgi:hypothetical protein